MVKQGEGLPAHVWRHQALARDDVQLRALVPDQAVEAALGVAGTTQADALTLVLEGYGARPAMGFRAYDVVVDAGTGRAVREYRPEFEEITYAELHRRVRAVASVLRQPDEYRVEPGDFVCILGFNGSDYVTVDLSCVFVQGVCVPLQSTMSNPALKGIFADTAPTLVASTVADVVLAAELVAAQNSVRTLVVFDFDERVDDDRDAVAAAEAILAQSASKARLVNLSELIASGGSLAWNPPPPSPEGLERMALLLHSSGTTGTPKGVIYTERMTRREFAPAPNLLPLVRLSFAPLNHGAGRSSLYGVLAHGGTVYFSPRPDLSMLFEDIRLVRPTDGSFFPRVLEMVYRHYQGEVARRLGDGEDDEDAVRSEVLAEMRDSFLGDRLCAIRAGGAPTAPEVRRFIEESLAIPFFDCYGATEVGSITINDRIDRHSVIEYRLRDVPELGYFSSDTPCPRGELCVKTRFVTPGYFKRPDATEGLCDADGFVLTGDIMEQRGPDQLLYVDRRNDVIKLAQGEFVAAGSLGTTFESASEIINQVFVYGSATRSYLLAVVVPNLELVRLTLGREPDETELRAMIRIEFQRVGVSAALKAFEIPRDFMVETEPFSQENGLLTAIRKRIRPAIHRKYAPQLEQLYADLEQRQDEELAALRGRSGNLSVLEKIGEALEASLGIDVVDVESPSNFTELGGDSLGATAFATLLEDIFGVDVAVSAILSPAGNPKQWARSVQAALDDSTRPVPTAATTHGKGARQLEAKDLDLAAFLDARLLEDAATEPAPAIARTVMLTGATGFLGRFLCLEWLERLTTVEGGKLVCLVRAPDHAAAVRRLDDVMTGGDARLEKRYRELAGTTLEVVVGDISEPSLGLDDAQFARLARVVDRVVHPAALVNHLLDYEFLFGPNVAGTAALIGFALSERKKAIDFVSSAAVWSFLDRRERDNEESPLLERVTLSQGYASGYGASKWAAEHLLHTASRRFGLAVNVFRGDMMLPHRSFHGQINVSDVFTRLIYSVIVTGLAPFSFYVLEPDGSRPHAHYDGLPVDFVAAFIAGMGAQPHEGIRTFNVTNHADDGLSLDVFVDWIEAADYPLEHVGDYEEWLTRFEAKLQALPEDKRHMTSLDVLESLRQPVVAQHPAAGSPHFDEALQTLDIGPETPQLTHDYINKFLDDMFDLGLIPIPAPSGRNTARPLSR